MGLPTSVGLRIVDSKGVDVAEGETGEIWIKGASVTRGYLNSPTANSASFTDAWFHSGDLGSRDAGGYLHVKGRVKEIINRGGDKVSPNDINAVLLANPKVLDAASFGEPDAIYREVVEAAVILREGMAADEDELRNYCSTRLSPFEVPAHIHIVGDLPHTSKGSIDTGALAQKFLGRPTPTHTGED